MTSGITSDDYNSTTNTNTTTTTTTTNQLKQLPQSASSSNKRIQKLKKQLKLREIQSLALEGGDTGRGYCSCDEQWATGSTTSSSSAAASPLHAVSPSPPPPLPPATVATSNIAAAAQQQPKLMLCQQNDAASSSSSSPLSRTANLKALASLTLLPTSSEIFPNTSTSETGNGPNDATNGNGYNSANKQCPSSTAPLMVATESVKTTSSLLVKHHQQQQQHQHPHQHHHQQYSPAPPLPTKHSQHYSSAYVEYGQQQSKSCRPSVAECVNENSFDALAASATSVLVSGSTRTITLRRNPIAAARLKQQHHVRFSDEKNFSD